MEILENELMSAHTSFKVGGPAKFFAKVENTHELVQIYQKALEYKLPCAIIGKGTNVLVSDKGFNGFIIQLGKSFSTIENLGENKFHIGGATPLARFARYSIQQGYAGIHKLAGIPGSIGGAIYMNAGAYNQEIANTCIEVNSIDVNGNTRTRKATDCKFGYRHSIFQESQCNNEIILSATFQLTQAIVLGKTVADLENEMQECMIKRRKSQPLSMPNAGSTFKRLTIGAKETPQQIAPGYYIEQTGLKGYRIGEAEISTIHANFIVNTGSATATEIIELCKYVQKKVADKFNIRLQHEIIFLGEF